MQQTLTAITTGVLGGEFEGLDDIVKHIMSEGVSSQEDLAMVEAENLPQYLTIPPIKVKRLIKAFHDAAAGPSGEWS